MAHGESAGFADAAAVAPGMAGPLLFTQVFSAVIAKNAKVRLPGAPYFLAGALLIAGLVVAAVVTREAGREPLAVSRKPREEEEDNQEKLFPVSAFTGT